MPVTPALPQMTLPNPYGNFMSFMAFMGSPYAYAESQKGLNPCVRVDADAFMLCVGLSVKLEGLARSR